MKKLFFSSLLVLLTLLGIVPRLAAQTTPQLTPRTVPFFEGFENGNTNEKKVAGWAQQSESGDRSWVANSTYTTFNRTPYEGKWNATLFRNNTDWLYTLVSLKADTPYDISLCARQNSNIPYYAKITVALGNVMDKDSMTITIIPETGIKDGDYQWLRGTFSVPADGDYVLGIKGYITDYPRHISIDNIMLQEHTAHAITIPEQECGTLTATPSSAYMGDTVTLNYTMNTGYFFKDYTTNVSVRWVAANRFIMPAEDVTIALDAVAPKAIPYFEGFEEGNTDQKKVAGWLQQGKNSNNSWVANSTKTDYNRTPYDGSWNAYLYGGANDWLFQAFTFEADKEYAFSMWARSHYREEISVMLGSDANKDAMSFTVLPTTTLSTSDYQYLSGKITVETTGTYFIGIRGYSQNGVNAISIDNIMVREAQSHTITCTGTHATLDADKTEASLGDTITLSYTLKENSYWGNYTTDINVTWVDANRFIMPDAPVAVGNTAIAAKPIPYFEGFEDGNTQDAVVADWLQQSENGDNSWVANATKTDYNRTPYAGSWNAYLYGENTDWLFQGFLLDADKEYAFSMWARSYNTTEISVMLGNEANKEAMSVTVVPTTTLSTKDYQYLSGKITVETTGTYFIGIRGYSQYVYNAISIDNIIVREAQAHTITLNGTHAKLTADKATASVGDTVTLSYTLDENYAWVNYTTDVDVKWIDANRFIMPDEAVTVGNTAMAAKPIPYFEGFEEGNTNQKNVAGWVQQSEIGDHSWVANSTYTTNNRTPYAGKWNATLFYGNTDWLFQALALEAGENYVLSLYARQDYENTSYANITAALGNAFNKDSMTTTILPATGLTYGDYQLLTDTFKVAETKVYVLGIKGYISTSPFYISMDNILVEQKVYPASIATPVGVDGFTEDAARAALATLSLTAQDSKGNTKCTITNLAENWVLDLENKKATYTVADSLLPVGYYCTDTITVDLVLNQYTLTIGEASNGSVKVAVNGKDTTATTFAYGTKVTLTATANEHYHFVQWSDGTKDATYIFTLTGDTTLTAEFAINQHTVTIGEAENGSVKVTVDGKDTTATTFDYGTVLTLTATANVGYSFEKWDDGNTDNQREITLTKDIVITAIFKRDAPTQLLEATTETKVQKVLRNGQVFILRNGNTYDLTGRKTE